MFIFHFTGFVKEITFVAICFQVYYDESVKKRRRFQNGQSAQQKGSDHNGRKNGSTIIVTR